MKGFLLTRQWDDVQLNPGGTGQHSSLRDKQLLLTAWLSTEQGAVKVLFTDQQAVFFVETDQIAGAQALLEQHFGRMYSEQYVRGRWYSRSVALKSFAQQPVHAVYFREQRSLFRARDLLRQHDIIPLEADIQPADRFLMERFITGGMEFDGELVEREGFIECRDPLCQPCDYKPAFTIVSLDIETAIQGEQLYSIGVLAVNDEQVIDKRVFMLGEPETDNGKPQVEIAWCQSEAQLLQSFLRWLADIDPDVLIGWNVINFDLRFLQRVADRLRIAFTLGREQQLPDWRQSRNDDEHYTLLVPGRAVLDGIDTLKSATFNFESFALQFVASALLERGKLIHDPDDRGGEITRLFHEDKPALAAYNLEDCQLVWDIFVETRLLDFAVERAQLTGLAIDRFGGSVAAFDNRYLPRLHRSGYIAPNLPEDPEGVGSPGGYVMTSFPGLYDHVLVLDFKSLYPSIIRSFQIDPLALLQGLAQSPQEAVKDRQETQDVDVAQFVPGFNGAVFSREHAILPDIIGELWAARDHAKRENNSAMSQAIKILMNSFYGVMGTPGCRFFDYRLPSSITLRGHAILTRSKQWIEARGHEVIYGDTDSVFVRVHGHDGSNSEVQAIGQKLAAELNHWWAEQLQTQYQLESYLEIEFETHFTRFLMPTVRGAETGSKKRYAGLVAVPDDNGNNSDGDEKNNSEASLIFKGLESVRTDWTMMARNFQRELYRRIFYGEPYRDYIAELVSLVRNGGLDDQLVYRKRIRRRLQDYERNIPPHVQAARKADAIRKQQGLPLRYARGGWIEYVMTVNGAEPLEYATSPLDYDLYVERQMEPIADGILTFVGDSFTAITSQQMGLFN